MKNSVLNVMANMVEKTVRTSVNSAEFFTIYQFKESDALKKNNIKNNMKGNFYEEIFIDC